MILTVWRLIKGLATNYKALLSKIYRHWVVKMGGHVIPAIACTHQPPLQQLRVIEELF